MEPSPLLTAHNDSAVSVRKDCLWKKPNARRVRLWKRRSAEKSKNRLSRSAWKSRKKRGIPTFPQPRLLLEVNLNRTFHLLRKPDILICYKQNIRSRISAPKGLSGVRASEK